MQRIYEFLPDMFRGILAASCEGGEVGVKPRRADDGYVPGTLS